MSITYTQFHELSDLVKAAENIQQQLNDAKTTGDELGERFQLEKMAINHHILVMRLQWLLSRQHIITRG